MICSYCKKPKSPCFKIVEQKGQGAVERLACFPCVSKIGEKAMIEHRRKEIEAAERKPPGTAP